MGPESLAGQFATQGIACRALGSELWADMCSRFAIDLRRRGATWDLLSDHADARFGLAVPLRLLGGLHRLALSGAAPRLAALLPSCGATVVDPDATWRVLDALVSDPSAELRATLDLHVQTNEVGRAAALVVGLATLAREWSLPFDLAEIGASAGLNLQLDRFAYRSGQRRGGVIDSELLLDDVWDPPWDTTTVNRVRILERFGCDPHPGDPGSAEGALRLRSFVWPDQTARFARLEAAIRIATEQPCHVTRSRAVDWLPGILDQPRTAGLVVMHSVMWQYVDKPERAQITALIEAAGAAADRDHPLAWLSYEPDLADRRRAALCVRTWPGDGSLRRLAVGGYHGQNVCVSE
jgi:hypothetical protein